ncbi:MAG: CDP-diacylglycerol--serine O-phosphatidyltransferase [Myxococcota bacterium]
MSSSEPSNSTETPKRSWRDRRRTRRHWGEGGRNFAVLLPHILTTGNLAAGFYAIVKASEGDFVRACVALIIAALFDAFDGRVARMARTTSPFGLEYDSIADTVSFGVAPAIMAFYAGAFHELGWTGWVMAFMYTACAALRLARFNISPGRYRGRFEGLPSPAGAGMVLSTVWLAVFLKESGVPLGLPASLPALGVAALGLLMVSPIPYRSFKEIHLPGSYPAIVLGVVGFAVILSKPSVTLFFVGIAYVSSGPLEWWWRRRTGRTLEEIAAPVDIPEEEKQRTTS